MYVPTFFIILSIIGIAYMFFFNKKQKDEESAEKLAYFNEKFEKDYETINSYHTRLIELTKLLIDLFMATTIKLLIVENGEKWEKITKRMNEGDGKAEEELDKWTMSAKNKKITELYSLKLYLHSFIGKYDELFNYWPKILKKFTNGKTNLLQRTLNDILEASMYFDHFHSQVGKKGYMKDMNIAGLQTEMEKLDLGLSRVLSACKERYFEND